MSRFLSILPLVALTSSLLLAQEPKPNEAELTKEERAKLAAEVFRLSQEGFKLHQAAKLPEAEKAFRQALQLNQKLYPLASFPQGHPRLATSLNNLAALLQAQGQLTQATPLYRHALAMRQVLYPQARF